MKTERTFKENHHEYVTRVAKLLQEQFGKRGSKVMADFGRIWGFEKPPEFERIPELCLFALVPTRALFSRMTCIGSDDLEWRHPDIAVEQQGKLYIVDVCGKNESTMRIARKIETYLCNAHSNHRFVGMGLVCLPFVRHKELDANYAALLKTFSLITGAKGLGQNPCVTDMLKSLINDFSLDKHYGQPDGKRIIELEATGNWQKELVKHAQQCLA